MPVPVFWLSLWTTQNTDETPNSGTGIPFSRKAFSSRLSPHWRKAGTLPGYKYKAAWHGGQFLQKLLQNGIHIIIVRWVLLIKIEFFWSRQIFLDDLRQYNFRPVSFFLELDGFIHGHPPMDGHNIFVFIRTEDIFIRLRKIKPLQKKCPGVNGRHQLRLLYNPLKEHGNPQIQRELGNGLFFYNGTCSHSTVPAGYQFSRCPDSAL